MSATQKTAFAGTRTSSHFSNYFASISTVRKCRYSSKPRVIEYIRAVLNCKRPRTQQLRIRHKRLSDGYQKLFPPLWILTQWRRPRHQYLTLRHWQVDGLTFDSGVGNGPSLLFSLT